MAVTLADIAGEGTESSPYQITTIDEFIEAAKQYNVYLKLMNDLDWNDYTGYMTPTVEIRAADIDGNGHGIYNAYCYNTSYFNYTDADGPYTISQLTIHDLILEIVQVGNATLFVGHEVSSNCKKDYLFLNCDLRIKSYPIGTSLQGNALIYSSDAFSTRVWISFRECVITIDVYGMSSGFSIFRNYDNTSSSFQFCEVKINVINSNKQNFYCFRQFNIYNLAIFIDVDSAVDTTVITGSKLSNSYFVLRNTKSDEKPKLYIQNANISSTCFYNSDLSDINGSFSNLYGLTTAQCKDPAYLTDLGFIVS